jgi:hypothetical protein
VNKVLTTTRSTDGRPTSGSMSSELKNRREAPLSKTSFADVTLGTPAVAPSPARIRQSAEQSDKFLPLGAPLKGRIHGRIEGAIVLREGGPRLRFSASPFRWLLFSVCVHPAVGLWSFPRNHQIEESSEHERRISTKDAG